MKYFCTCPDHLANVVLEDRHAHEGNSAVCSAVVQGPAAATVRLPVVRVGHTHRVAERRQYRREAVTSVQISTASKTGATINREGERLSSMTQEVARIGRRAGAGLGEVETGEGVRLGLITPRFRRERQSYCIHSDHS